MNTPTPIVNGSGVNGIKALAAMISNGLPDEATLTRLASELFAALPGGASETLPHAAPQPPMTEAALAQRAATAAPTVSSGSGVPESALHQSSGTGGPGGALLSVPEAYAAAPPQVSPSGYVQTATAAPALPATPPSSPYYFLGESSAYSGGNGAPNPTRDAPNPTRGAPAPTASALPGNDSSTLAAPPAISNDETLVAQSFGLPSGDALKALLADLGGNNPRNTEPVAGSHAPSLASSGNFYFIDPLHARNSQTSALPVSAHPAFDVNAVRRDFPILQESVNGRPLIWFDNAATTQKPQAVIDRLAYFYAHENSNIHRAAHELAARATDAYEAARQKVRRFLGASSPEEIIFVRGATEAINLVAKTWGKQHLQKDDEIIVSLLEHHANIVPWQQLAAETGAKIRVIPVDDSGQILLEEYQRLLNPRTKLVAVTQVSNALGTVTPIKAVIDAAHRNGSCVLVDGAQAVSHMRVNVQALDADFYIFSGHKVFGPTGIGAVYGKKSILETMAPWQGGGNMIQDVTFERTIYQPAPARFEAGTGNIADAVGLGAAIDYVEKLGMENIARYEHDLLAYATHSLKSVPGLRLIGTAADKASVASFVLDGHSNDDVGKALNREGIAVRTGHHCAQPILRRFGLESCVRPSLAFYNTCQEIDVMIAALHRLQANHRQNH